MSNVEVNCPVLNCISLANGNIFEAEKTSLIWTTTQITNKIQSF